MKDDYIKFIRREQLRREKEFKDRSHDKEIVYNKIKNTFKSSESSFAHNEERKYSKATHCSMTS